MTGTPADTGPPPTDLRRVLAVSSTPQDADHGAARAMARVPPMRLRSHTAMPSSDDRVWRDEWRGRLAAALEDGTPGVYVNFLGDEGE